MNETVQTEDENSTDNKNDTVYAVSTSSSRINSMILTHYDNMSDALAKASSLAEDKADGKYHDVQTPETDSVWCGIVIEEMAMSPNVEHSYSVQRMSRDAAEALCI